MLVQILTAPPAGYGDTVSVPPESILTRGAPTLDLRLVPINGVIVLSVWVWFDGGWAKIRTYSLYAHESTDAQYYRLSISESVLYACVVRESGTGTADVYIEGTWALLQGSGGTAPQIPGGYTSAAIIRWESFVAQAGQRSFTISEPVAAFVMVFYDDKPLFEVTNGFTATDRTIELAGSAWEGKIVMVGYQPALPGA